MTKDEVINRLCALVSRVGAEAFDDAYTHDCFCGDSNMRLRPEDIRVEELVLEWLEDAVEEKLRVSTPSGNPYKLYVWRRQPLYVVMVHATSIARARELALEESKGCGDDSTPVRRQAYDAVRTTTPEMHYREVAEFVLTDSAELQEAEHEIDELKALLALALTLGKTYRTEELEALKATVKRHGVKT